MIVERAFPPLEGGLALAASVAALEALIFAPLLLPPAVALLAAELVVSVHRGELALWTCRFSPSAFSSSTRQESCATGSRRTLSLNPGRFAPWQAGLR